MDFEDTERFEIRRRLGSGGMGVVYEAWDRQRQELVALKTLTHVEGSAIYRLKREFRALADVTHPNLIALHELFSEGDRWFFTMDLIDGREFVEYVRDAPRQRSAETLTSTPPFDWYLDETPGPQGEEPQVNTACSFDESKLRRALAQLADGVAAIHRAGKLHRDLKPSNVLVSKGGRLTILDFGVATARAPDAAFETVRTKAEGTPSYMAPEQALEAEIDEAADWYSVGVMLYEALTGVLPFAGTIVQVVAAKQQSEPTHPSELVAGLPADLAELCARLLARHPESRAGEEEVFRVVGQPRSPAGQGRSPSWLPSAAAPAGRLPAFVGRRAELEALRNAFRARRLGRPVWVQVRGSAGVGKTALVRRFLQDLRDTAVILAGRCYECESVPYKALDAVIDSLARFLRRLSPPQAAALMPRDAYALARIFPVLTRVEAVVDAPSRAVPSPDPAMIRQHGFTALKELLARIGDRHPLVVFIDDLQWGDVDSATLLAELLLPPDPPCLLLVAAYRHDEASTSPMLTALGEVPWRQRGGVDWREVLVDGLPEADAEQLVVGLHPQAQLPADWVERILQDSDGNPLFIGELVRRLADRDRPLRRVAGVGLADLLQERLDALDAGQRALLEVIAVAGGPILPTTAAWAAGHERAGPRALKMLSAAAITRGAWLYGRPAVDVFHDRIRHAVLEGLSEQRRAGWHGRIAAALERLEIDDPERLAVHLEGAGEPDGAAPFAARAAAAAVEGLAFERAVRLYRRALDLSSAPPRSDWLEGLGDALAHGGRSAEAAEAYLAAAAHADAARALDLRRQAAEHLLRSGHTDRGLELMDQVLGALGMHLAASPRRALVSLAYLRTRLRARGLEPARRDGQGLTAEQHQRMDACWSVAVGLSMVDTIHGAEFHARHLIHALDAGDASRLARALAMEAGHVSSTAPERHDRAEALLDRAESMAEPIGDWHALGLAKTMRGLNALFAGQWRVAAEHTDEAMTMLRERCSNVAWEIATARRYNLVALYYLGELVEQARRVREYLADARARGDRFSQSCVASGSSVVTWLKEDEADEAVELLEDEVAHGSRRGFQLQEYLALQGWVYVDLYEGRGRRAHRRLVEAWPTMRRSLLLRVQLLRRTMWALRARAALAVGDEPRLAEAEHYLSRLDDSEIRSAKALAHLLRAGLAYRRGATDDALTLFRQSAGELEALEMHFKAAAAERRWGLLLGGDEGAQRVAHADGFMRKQGIQAPERMAELVVPCGSLDR